MLVSPMKPQSWWTEDSQENQKYSRKGSSGVRAKNGILTPSRKGSLILNVSCRAGTALHLLAPAGRIASAHKTGKGGARISMKVVAH